MKNKNKSFAMNVFNHRIMKKFLKRKTYKAVIEAESGQSCVTSEVADEVAEALKKWANGMGVTRFTHRFQPLNNFTAGKRDSLYSIDNLGKPVTKFRGKELQKGEGDASSFPNGGIRQTFEARGTTAWDCTSSAFIQNGCLCIPSTFCSCTGEALDKKTPLLRSALALNKQALRLLKLVGEPCKRVFSVVGAEQEYFLIDKKLFLQRPDLMFTGRTLVGAPPPKGQELYDHYYRPPHEKTVKFWEAVDEELWKLGIIAKTEHNEVAPSQFELAPCYSPVNISCDQNQIIMETLESVADRFDLVCLLHEKPFDKVNGSGKHNNWSLLTDADCNLFEAGDTPVSQARFMLFVACTVKAVDEFQDLLRLSIGNAANDCRLGGFEAPPNVISIFLGELSEIFDKAFRDDNWKMGSNLLMQIPVVTDRNRTSPFAFTGNKFEFRMVGASASLADSNTVLNTIVAHTLKEFADTLEKSTDFWRDAKQLIKEVFQKHGRIVFNKNNYSPQWLDEAKQRGLSAIANTPQAIDCLLADKNIELFLETGVFSEKELQALQQIHFENYGNTILIECKTLADITMKQIIPAVNEYIKTLSEIAERNCKSDLPNYGQKELQALTKTNGKLLWHCKKLKRQTEYCQALSTSREKAFFACEQLLKEMSIVRKHADTLEQITPKKLWPLPTYGELLFGK